MSERWDDLTHEQKIQIMKDFDDPDIVENYLPPDKKPEEFYRILHNERNLWNPRDLGSAKKAGGPPKKEALVGSWREIDKSEAILELTDNSIDAWMRRQERCPNENAPKLKIYIMFNAVDKPTILTYEDNAGGVPEHLLNNLVIPGFSETSDIDRTIGSYKTGGKKAVFKLASDTNIKTWYWNPSGTSDDAFEIHLDKGWIEDPVRYEFDYFPLLNRSLDRGQTIYNIRLRELDRWDIADRQKINEDLRRTYTLLMIRNPNIEIYFNNRTKPLEPSEDLYKFTRAHTSELDLRPQKVMFKCKQTWQAVEHDVDIEMILGCRTNTAQSRGDDSWGIDVYGNGRLFKPYDQDQIYSLLKLPLGNAGKFVRGLINISGPNVLMPWDTHKRHLTSDRDINEVLKKEPRIREFVSNWSKVYSAVGQLPKMADLVKNRMEPPWVVRGGQRDINVVHDKNMKTQVVILTKQKGEAKQSLPDYIHKPKVQEASPKIVERTLDIRFQITKEEFRRLCTKFDLDEPNETEAKKLLAEAIKANVLRSK